MGGKGSGEEEGGGGGVAGGGRGEGTGGRGKSLKGIASEDEDPVLLSTPLVKKMGRGADTVSPYKGAGHTKYRGNNISGGGS